jgi:hypothetical protein
MSIKDEELTAKGVALDLGIGTLLSIASAGAAHSLFGISKSAAKGSTKLEGAGIDLATNESKDFVAFTDTVKDGLEDAHRKITHTVATRAKTGEPYVRSVMNDHLLRSQEDLLRVGMNVENKAFKLLETPPVAPQVVETSSQRLLGAGAVPEQAAVAGAGGPVTRIADIPNDFLAAGATSRNIKQYIDEVADETLGVAGPDAVRETRAVRNAQRKITDLLQPKGETFGTGATKGRSNISNSADGAGRGAEFFADPKNADALKAAYQEYYDATLALGRKAGVTDVEDRLLDGATAYSGRGMANLFGDEGSVGTFAPTGGGLRQLIADANATRSAGLAAEHAAGQSARNAALKAEFRANAAARPGMEEAAAAATTARRETAIAAAAQHEAEVAKFARIQQAAAETKAAGEALGAAGGLGDSISLGAAPGEAFLRHGLAQDYLDSLSKLARETGQELPESLSKQMDALRDDMMAIGARQEFGALTGADMLAVRKARSGFRRADLSISSLINGSQDDVLKSLTRLEDYHVALVNASNKVAIPGVVEQLNANVAQMTARLEGMTGLSSKQIDKSYNEIAKALGGPEVEFTGPSMDLYRAWVVNQAMKAGGGAFGKATGQAMRKSLFTSAAESGLSRVASQAAWMVGGAVGGPMVGAMAAGATRLIAGRTIRDSGIVSQAAGKLLHAVSTVAKAAGHANRRLNPALIGSLVRNTSFDGSEPPKKETPRQSFDRLTKQITAIATDPNAQVRLNDALGDVRAVNWGVGDKLEMQVMKAVAYLNKNIPRSSGVLQQWGFDSWRATDAEVHGFNLRVAAVKDPINSLKRFVAGGGSPQEADAIRNVHGIVFEKFQDGIMETLTEDRTKFDGPTRVRLGILFDAPVDSRLRPEFREFMKQNWVARAEEQKPIDIKSGMNPSEPTAAQKLLS